MFDLSQVTTNKQVQPPRIIIYGTPKIGKTSFAANADKPIILDLEGGSDNIDVARVSREALPSFNSVMDVLRSLYTEQHDYKTVVIDSIDWLERMIFDEVAKEHGAKTIDDYKVAALGFGKGYTIALNIIKSLLAALDKLRVHRGMTIILICHSAVKKFTDPESESFDRFTLKLNEKVEGLLKEWSDCILFAKQKVFVTTSEEGFNRKVNKGRSGDRVIYTQEAASYLAGNRYELPNEMPLDFKTFWNEFKARTNYGKAAPKANKPKEIQIPTITPANGISPAAYQTTNGSYGHAEYLEL